MYINTQNMQAIGLVFDAAGISILGVPAAFRMVNEVAAQMGTYFGFNPPLGRALAQSRIDITFGSILLLVGFGMQLTSLLGFEFLNSAGSIVLVALLTSVIIYWAGVRRWLSNKLFEAAHRANQKQQEAAKGG